ncbi:MAG: patatin-like phospholipase family protein [Burkholderiaceae bacterium]|nr:patatin-like phospholipase family protein [Burkholderiaceae bacterium]
MKALEFRAGPQALAHLRQHGLRAHDVAAIPAAAGGPKGLILQALDQWLFGTWLPAAPRTRTLIGASVGSWRMAAACHTDPVAAFQRLGDLYCGQTYPAKPPPHLVTTIFKQFLHDIIGGHEAEIVSHPGNRLHILAVRGRGLLKAPKRRMTMAVGFAGAALANLRSRNGLAGHLERVVIGDPRDAADWLKTPFDGFTTHFAPLSADNVEEALLASGTLPMVMLPVPGVRHAPPGTYWDGGLIDYHLALPYARIAPQTAASNLVLYPHFGPQIVPGWLDKSLPWRRELKRQRHWFDNMLLVSPSKAFLQTLPRGKLPDREDLYHYGTDDAARIRNWKKAIGEAQRLRDEFAAFAENPDLSLVRPL